MVAQKTLRSIAFIAFLLFSAAFSWRLVAATDNKPEANLGAQNAVPLPARCDLRPEFKNLGFEPRRQGHRGTCSVFTVTAAMEFALAKKLDKPTPLSVEYLNWAAAQVIRHDSDGNFFHNLIRGYQDYGICCEDLMPYRMAYDPAFQPSTEARENARSLRQIPLKINWINPWSHQRGLTDEQITKIKEILVNGWPVGAGSGHSRLFVGYRDDPDQPGGGRFITKDSAVGGYARVSYEWAKKNVIDVFWIEPDVQQSEAKEKKTPSPQ
jgi:hypothetical protein